MPSDNATPAGNGTSADKVIIEVAVNGGTSKRRNPNVPISSDEIVADALACMESGAAIVHQHDAEGGVSAAHTAEQSAQTYSRVLAERPDALLYPTATFVDRFPERWAHQELLAGSIGLRMAYADPGSVNLGRVGANDPSRASAFVYCNSHADWAYQVERCAELSIAPSIAIFEPGHLRTVLAYDDAGRLPAGAFVKLYFGGGGAYSFGLEPTETALDLYIAMIGDRTFEWAVAVLGGDVVGSGMARWAIERGGHVRVGLEDYAGDRQPTNRTLVEEAAQLVTALGRTCATPAEAAALLGMPS